MDRNLPVSRILRRKFNVLIKEYLDRYAAFLIEYHMAAQGSTMLEAQEALENLIVNQLKLDIAYDSEPFVYWIPNTLKDILKDFDEAKIIPNSKIFLKKHILPKGYELEVQIMETRLLKFFE